jgi:ubiquitin-activating enzyme E1 C
MLGRVLVVGVGGVGCEVLLQLSGLENAFEELTIIDSDTVEESNLSRQALYTHDDIGRSKALCAAERLVHVHSVPVHKVLALDTAVERIADLLFFRQFNVVILAVDNGETRRWINAAMFQSGSDDFVLIDLGVQGFQASIRRYQSSSQAIKEPCLECTHGLIAAETGFDAIPLCSLVGRPRTLHDCILWALYSEGRATGRLEIELESVLEAAKTRAETHKLSTAGLSMEMVRAIVNGQTAIPAIASVNSLIAALALAWTLGPDDGCNFMYLNAEDGFYCVRLRLEADPQCVVCICSSGPRSSGIETAQDMIE